MASQFKSCLRWLSFSSICLIALSTTSCSNTKANSNEYSNTPKVQTVSDTKVAETPITITNKGCEPNQVSVKPGYNSFVITNKSSQPLEWEILQGVKVIEERENIAPNFVQKLKANLDAGEYQMACGLRSNPLGKLTVAGSSGTQAAKPDTGKLVGAIAEYKVYVTNEIDQMVPKTKAFTDAVIAGNVEKAKKLYAPAHVHWERSEPIAELFSDLDKSMDSRADDFEKKEADPQFTGFHRLELALFQNNTTKDMKPVAEKLMQDTLTLQKRIKELTIEPKNMVGGAAELIEEVAKTKISGEEDRYSHTDLWDFNSNIEGSQKIVALLHPLVEKANPDLVKRVDDNFAKVNSSLAKYKSADGGFVTYDKITDADKKDMKASITALAEDLSQLRGTLSVE